MRATIRAGALLIVLLLLCVSQSLSPLAVLAADDREAGQASGVATTVTSDVYVDRQWALARFQNLLDGSGGEGVLVAVLDTGIDGQHEDLKGKVVASVNFSDSPTALDRSGHGTHVAGIIAAITNNGVGIAGAAPSARLLNVKVADDDGMVWASAVAKGIVWAVDNGARVINLSLAIPGSVPTLEEAVDYAWSRGAVLVAAAGNAGDSAPTYPASLPHVISVAAVDINGKLWDKSNYGDWVCVYGPGVDIYSTLPGNEYGYKSGTSMATAFVSAVAAHLYTVATDANGDGKVNDEVAEALKAIFALPQ